MQLCQNFGISGGFEHPKPHLGMPLARPDLHTRIFHFNQYTYAWHPRAHDIYFK